MLLPHRMYLIESKVRFVVRVLVWADNAKRCKVGSKKQNNCERLKFLDLGGRFYGKKRPFYGKKTSYLWCVYGLSTVQLFPVSAATQHWRKNRTQKTPERTFADHQIVWISRTILSQSNKDESSIIPFEVIDAAICFRPAKVVGKSLDAKNGLCHAKNVLSAKA